MKKSIVALMLIATAFVSCKKEEVKPVDQSTELQEVPLEEKTVYTYALEWTAFKTPEKVGVKGSFDSIELIGAKDTGKVEEDIKDATFKINSLTVNTTDPTRDAKLKDGFFNVMAGGVITGKFVDFKDNKAHVEITMNGVTAEKEFAYTVEGETLKIHGSIDIIKDFKGETAFNSIHELCKDLHMGKTWTDVDINVTIGKK